MVDVTNPLARVKVDLFEGCVRTHQEEMERALLAEVMRHRKTCCQMSVLCLGRSQAVH